MSPETYEVFADLLNQVVLPLTDPDFEEKARKLAAAKRELAKLSTPQADDKVTT